MEEQKTKIWKTVGTYNNYDEATIKKNELSELYQEVKVKRGGKEGALFRVKAWSPSLKESKSKKKGKKNVDKKIRNRSEGQ